MWEKQSESEVEPMLEKQSESEVEPRWGGTLKFPQQGAHIDEPMWESSPEYPRYNFDDMILAPVPPTPGIHLLSSYDDVCGLTSPKAKYVMKLPVLYPFGGINEEYKVIISRRLHDELGKTYMIEHNPVHEKRRYVAWFGFDLDDFGKIFDGETFFHMLEIALSSEKFIVQDSVPLGGPDFPKRALWMSMYGYFGNWYKPEERKWAITAVKRHTRLLRKLCERGDIELVDEYLADDAHVPKCLRTYRHRGTESDPMIRTTPDLTNKSDTWLCSPRALVFPRLLVEKSLLGRAERKEKAEKEKEKEKRMHGCAHA